MKVITVTTYNVYNYGAALQAYALQKYLIELGHHAELLNYQPAYLNTRYDYKWVNPESPLSKYAITRFAYRIAKYLQRQTTLRRKRAFDTFISQRLLQTILYRNKEDLISQQPSADVFIVGSDQVWNTFYEAGRDSVFYLDFVKNGRKASYAASFSFLDIEDSIKSMIKQWLTKFDFISVREYQGVDILKSMGLNGMWVLDPVFLLEVNQWKCLFKEIKGIEPYLLIYDFERNEDMKKFAKLYAKRNNLKIYSINDTYPKLYVDRNFNGEGPDVFLSLIYNCSCFISNSFHGTAFSIMFHKPFYVFGRHRHAVNSRMESLLKMFDLEDRFINSFDNSEDINNTCINWAKIETIKDEYLEQSKRYLANVLQ